MNHMEPRVGFSVRDRAQKFEKNKSRIARTWDEGADAVPMPKRRVEREAAKAAAPLEKRTSNPYRVRESMAKASEARAAARRASTDGTSPPSGAAPPRTKKRTASRREPIRTENEYRGIPLDDAQRVSEYRRAVRKKLAHSVMRVAAAVLIVCVCLVCALGIVYKSFYVIDDVSVEGATLYGAGDILEASGIRSGANLYSFSSRIAEENITLHCPYVREVSVDRTAPGGVRLTVSEDSAAFYAELYGETRALSPSLRVLEPISEAEAQGQGLIRLCLPAVEEAISGRVLRFADERYEELIAQITTATLSCNLRQRITVIDLRKLHALQMICDGQYLLKLGEVAEIDMKLKVANAVMADTLFCSSVKAQIDLTLSGETSVVLDNQLDLEW